MPAIELTAVRVLVVDDNAHMRRILRTLLSGIGVRDVTEAEDGADGLDAFRTGVHDIVILDWVMPILDGCEVTRMMRDPTSSPNPYVPIIVVTGYAEKQTVFAARDAGVTEFLCKPISAKQLYDRIVSVVVNPRPFVRTKSYFGPDRRRFQSVMPNGQDRRLSSSPLPASPAPDGGRPHWRSPL